MDCSIVQSCMALVNIKIPVFTDVCELSVKELHCSSICWAQQLLHVTWGQVIWWAIHFGGFYLATYDKQRAIKDKGICQNQDCSKTASEEVTSPLISQLDNGERCQGGCAKKKRNRSLLWVFRASNFYGGPAAGSITALTSRHTVCPRSISSCSSSRLKRRVKFVFHFCMVKLYQPHFIFKEDIVFLREQSLFRTHVQ